MIPSKLLYAVSNALDAAAATSDSSLCSMMHELRLVQADLRSELEDIDAAHDDEALLKAMGRWNESAIWAEMLVSALSDKINQRTTPYVHLSPRYPHANIE